MPSRRVPRPDGVLDVQVTVDGPVGDRPLAERPERTLDVGRQRLVRLGGEVVEQVEVEGELHIVAAVPFVLVMGALCVSLWKDLQTDPMMVRGRLGEEMVEDAVVTGVEEHDGDFALVVEPSDSSTGDTKR